MTNQVALSPYLNIPLLEMPNKTRPHSPSAPSIHTMSSEHSLFKEIKLTKDYPNVLHSKIGRCLQWICCWDSRDIKASIITSNARKESDHLGTPEEACNHYIDGLRKAQTQASPRERWKYSVMLAREYYNAQQYQEACKCLKSIPEENCSVDVLQLYALALKENQQLLKSHEIYDKILARNGHAKFVATETLKAEQGEVVEAIKAKKVKSVKECEFLIRYDPEYRNVLANYYVNEGKKCFYSDLTKAFHHFVSASEYNTLFGKAWAERCFITGLVIDRHEAMKWYQFGNSRGYAEAAVSLNMENLQEAMENNDLDKCLACAAVLRQHEYGRARVLAALAQFYAKFNHFNDDHSEFNQLSNVKDNRVISDISNFVIGKTLKYPYAIPFAKKAAMMGCQTSLELLSTFRRAYRHALHSVTELQKVQYCNEMIDYCTPISDKPQTMKKELENLRELIEGPKEQSTN